MKFGEIIKELRLAAGLSQGQFAKKIGFTQSKISAWEIGLNQPVAAAIDKAADFFGVTTDYLLGKENYDGTKIKKNSPNYLSSAKTIVVNEEQREILAKYDAAPKNIQEAVKKLLS